MIKSWNNGKEVPRWGIAEIQKMSPPTTVGDAAAVLSNKGVPQFCVILGDRTSDQDNGWDRNNIYFEECTTYCRPIVPKWNQHRQSKLKVVGGCAVYFLPSSYLISSSSLLFFLFFQPHSSNLCLVGGKVWTHLTVVMAETETEATLASVSTGGEVAGKVPLRVIATVVEIRLLA